MQVIHLLVIVIVIYCYLHLKQTEIPHLYQSSSLVLKAVLYWSKVWLSEQLKGPILFTTNPDSLHFYLTRSPCPKGGRDTYEFKNRDVPESQVAFFHPDSAAASLCSWGSLSLALPLSPVPSFSTSSSLSQVITLTLVCLLPPIPNCLWLSPYTLLSVPYCSQTTNKH